jgi:hypothetical protein
MISDYTRRGVSLATRSFRRNETDRIAIIADLLYDTVRIETPSVNRSAEYDPNPSVNQEVAAMTHTHIPGIAAQPAPFLSERENQRAVDVIENAERSAPYCHCGRHMIAVADGSQVWLECSDRSVQKTGIAGFVARITAFSHTRRMIMELPNS